MDNEFFQNLFIEEVLEKDPSPSLLLEVSPGGDLNAKDAIAVYQNDYLARLTEALGKKYEGVWFTVGDDDFFSLCRDFINLQPSLSYNLNQYGSEFPEFLLNQYKHEGNLLAFDMAKFERSFDQLFHQELEVVDLKQIPTNLDFTLFDKRWTFSNNLKWINSNYQILDLWKLKNKNADEQFSINLEINRPSNYLYFKNESGIYFEAVSMSIYVLVENMAKGRKPMQVIDELCAQDIPINEKDIETFFSFLFKNQLIKAIDD